MEMAILHPRRVSPGQHGKQVPQLLVHFAWFGHRLGDFIPQLAADLLSFCFLRRQNLVGQTSQMFLQGK